MQARFSFTCAALLLMNACSSEGKPSGGGGGGGGGNGNGNGGKVSTAGSTGNFGGQIHTGPMFAGADCPADLGLPDAYALPNVKAVMNGSNARVTFDPQADAADYRIYVLPTKADISGNAVKNATYRCAGRTAVPFPEQDDATTLEKTSVRTRVNSKVAGFARTDDDATLGYVFTSPGDGRIPVYALGDPNYFAENSHCYFMRWPETRVKKYTTSEQERKELLGQHWRDDGIAFYAFEAGAPGTHPIYTAAQKPADYSATFYFKDGAEKDRRAADALPIDEAFSVLSAAEDGAEPLMRVFYQLTCGRGHDELVPGLARFRRAYEQGDQPVTELHFSGLTEESTLVVEALDELCPLQGIISPMSRPARSNDTFQGVVLPYPKFQTPDELRATSATGELFVGGQGDATAPTAIARACLSVKPETPPEMDFQYDGSVEEFSEPVSTGFQIWEVESPTFNVQFHTVATDEWAIGSLFGEQWVVYADALADTNGKMRMTPKARATLSADKFVHATMEVDVISTQRRYPQLLISDVEWPVQDNLEQGSTVITQLFGGITEQMQVQLEFCDHRTWDVNNQCPRYNVDTFEAGTEELNLPRPEINAFFGVDRTVRFDVFASTARVYVYTNGLPYGCADLPAGKLKAGPATVTFGDVLYHSAVDLEEWYPFHVSKMQLLTSRHFSNLGFSSNVAAPSWDETRLPCAAEARAD